MKHIQIRSTGYICIVSLTKSRKFRGSRPRHCVLLPPESNRRKQVAVAPITHSPPHHPSVAVEIPPRVKQHLGLDGERSWVILEEVNIFTWPGFDLRPIRRDETRIDYGWMRASF